MREERNVEETSNRRRTTEEEEQNELTVKDKRVESMTEWIHHGEIRGYGPGSISNFLKN